MDDVTSIKYLVIAGGGPLGLRYLSALQHARTLGKWQQNNLKAIYATSIGAVVGALICLNYDDETLNKYLIERPWHDSFKIGAEHIFEAYSTKGVMDEKIIEVIMKPLLEAKGLHINISLAEFYHYSQIELKIFTVDINTYQLVPLSHNTHPNWRLVQAITASCALPGLFKPVIITDNNGTIACYIDGGVKCNYPLKICMDETKCTEDEIIGIKGCTNKTEPNQHLVTQESNLMDFVIALFVNSMTHIAQNNAPISIKNQIVCINDGNALTITNLSNAVCCAEVRRKLFADGIEDANNTFKSELNLTT